MATVLDELPKWYERHDPNISELDGWLARNASYRVLANIIEWRKTYNKYVSIDDGNVLSDDDENFNVSIEAKSFFQETERANQLTEVLRTNMQDDEFDLLIKHDVAGLSFETMAVGHPRSRPSIQRDYLKALYKARRIIRDFEAKQ